MKDIFVIVSAALATMVLVTTMLTIPVWLLWNWLMPVIFGLPEISVFQSAGLLLLTSLLFEKAGQTRGE